MKRSLILLAALLLSLAACSPAATPAPTQAPAAVPQAPAPAAQPTLAPLATALPEFKAPASGGVLNPPTLIPTVPGKSSVTSGQPQDWINFRDSVTGLAFQYPRNWPLTLSRNNKSTLESISVARANQPITNSVAILIDVRKKQGDLLTWIGQQLPIGSLLIDAKALEGGTASYKSYNARVGNNQAVFLYAPVHNRISDAAELHLADNQYFYQITYLGGSPDSLVDRATFLRLLNTLTLTGTAVSGLTLPQTAFTTGIDVSNLK